MEIEIQEPGWTRLDKTVSGEIYLTRNNVFVLAIKDDADQRLFVDVATGNLHQPDIMYRLRHMVNSKLVVEK